MINTQLSDALTEMNKIRAATIVTRVEIRPGKMMDRLAKGLYSEIQRLAPYSGFKPVAELEENDILKYLHTLIWLRVCYVNNDQSKSYAKYKYMAKHLEVPVLAYQLLVAIGEAYDKDYSIRFLPEYSVESEHLLSPDEMLTLSDLFCTMREIGFASVKGTPRDTSGELDFMAMCHVEGVVTSYRDTHPVYGFLASFFEQQKLNEITGSMSRIIYGYDTDYELYISSLIHSLRASQPEVRHD